MSVVGVGPTEEGEKVAAVFLAVGVARHMSKRGPPVAATNANTFDLTIDDSDEEPAPRPSKFSSRSRVVIDDAPAPSWPSPRLAACNVAAEDDDGAMVLPSLPFSAMAGVDKRVLSSATYPGPGGSRWRVCVRPGGLTGKDDLAACAVEGEQVRGEGRGGGVGEEGCRLGLPLRPAVLSSLPPLLGCLRCFITSTLQAVLLWLVCLRGPLNHRTRTFFPSVPPPSLSQIPHRYTIEVKVKFVITSTATGEENYWRNRAHMCACLP